MLFSQACIYGVRASVYLASESNRSYTSISKISKKLKISAHFLTKILQQLTHVGLLESMKGPRGGVRFARDTDDIYLVEIVAAIDGMDVLTECALGLPGCGTAKPCPLHEQWSVAREKIKEMLTNASLASIAQKSKKGNLRITPEGTFVWE